MLLQIEAPHFTAGVILDERGRVQRAAPIVGYMYENGWSKRDIELYCNRRGWRIIELA